MWHILLDGISGHSEAVQSALPILLDAAQQGILPKYLRPKDGELEGEVGTLVVEVLECSGRTPQLPILRQLLQISGEFS